MQLIRMEGSSGVFMMDGDIERILEFDKIKGIVSKYCSSGLGRSILDELEPFGDLEQIRHALNVCGEAKAINTVNDGLPLNGLYDIRHLMRKAGVSGIVLDTEELLQIASTIRVARKLRAFAGKFSEEYPLIAEIIEELLTFPHLEESINSCIDPEGNISDSASPLLAKIRKQLVTTRNRLMNLLESMLRSPNYQTSIQENVVTIRNNRYVIPVKQKFKGSLPGVIQGRSASVVTVFMEPAGAVPLNNELRELTDQEKAEIRRILRELTDKVREDLPLLEVTVDILSELDLINAKSIFCSRLDTTKPEINDQGYVELIQARHPLLQLGDNETRKADDREQSKVVPINFHIGDGFDTLVITGPNTGGKTVALKTVGLLTLMMQVGLHIPAQTGSKMSTFSNIFADIGDEQSIEQNLSTFSSHMTRIIRITEQADSTSLILLDELGAGTEPSEGAALGMAILDFLHSRNAKTIATTHHDSLKAHAYSREGMENASVSFDLKTLRPTYELRIGMPGSSNALRIANRLGLPDEIVEAARDYLGSEALGVADLISSVENMQSELEEQKRLTEEKTISASKAQLEHELLLRRLKSQRRDMEREALREASSIVQSAKKLVEKTISEVRKEKASPQIIQRARKELVQAKNQIEAAIEPPPVDEGREPAAGELRVGNEVYIKSLRTRGTLINLPSEKGIAQVRIGSARLNLPQADIRIVSASKTAGSGGKSAKSINLKYAKRGNVPQALHLRGDRAEEALKKVDKYLDDAALAGLQYVSIIHGRGAGILRQVVTEFLSEHPQVANFRLGERNEGGDGVTVVELVG